MRTDFVNTSGQGAPTTKAPSYVYFVYYRLYENYSVGLYENSLCGHKWAGDILAYHFKRDTWEVILFSLKMRRFIAPTMVRSVAM